MYTFTYTYMRAWVCLTPVHTCTYVVQGGNEAQDDLGDRSLPADEPCSQWLVCGISSIIQALLCFAICWRKYTPRARAFAFAPHVYISLCAPHPVLPPPVPHRPPLLHACAPAAALPPRPAPHCSQRRHAVASYHTAQQNNQEHYEGQ